ncbi:MULTISPECIES: SDR family oxidoreductase [Actinomadura]|uniref:SDR family oxidoreductase n=2 Tax=Actinomadura yumaensis TaxID=111807 RepID=A0ABW2CCW0_9ACTN|nr:SDR family oxidoreductase [Actinomadura sp. J1-007]MWK35647.1 SDR family oxidoreductase [Actinomadura sp. J1-007]
MADQSAGGTTAPSGPGIDLTGETAVVTGALGKLGPIWAGALLDAGARVVGLDLSTDAPPSLKEYEPDRLLLLESDVTVRDELAKALAECVDAFGPPTVLINNAGIDRPPTADGDSWRFGDIPDEVSTAIVDVNTLGVLRACQVFGSEMARRGRGSIINIGSLYAGMAPDPRLYEHLAQDPPFLKPPAYGMSKAGVCALSRYLAALWGRQGVRVNTLSPGGVSGGQDRRFRELFGARTPMGRMARTDELVGPMLFLASDLSGYVTGTELLVDGGYSCW